jgi:hypothetical protein
VKNPFQLPRLGEIEAGKRFWGYLDTEPFQARYVLAAHFVRESRHVVEIGGYRRNVITSFLTGHHESVTVYSLDAEFEPLERESLNGRPCRVRHIQDFFQGNDYPKNGLAVVALGLEIHGDVTAFHELVRAATIAVLEIPVDHAPSIECLDGVITAVNPKIRARVSMDLSPNEPALRDELRETNMNRPFWRRDLYVLESGG